jgi:hypothetical protein
MALWGKINQANNAPKYNILAEASANGAVMFANTTVSAFITNQVDGVYGQYANSTPKTHSGWNLRREGTGPVTGLTITVGGTGYSNSGVVTISGGTSNATANVTTNGSGVITAISNLTAGAGFKNSSNTVVAISGGGSGATLTPVLGGRAGRLHDEVLVATGSMA